MKSIAFIVPRYGAEIGGGAETLVRELVLNCFASRECPELDIGRVEVWTTCAMDHRTWQNDKPAGLSIEDGISVQRFSVDERDLDSFIHFETSMREGRTLGLEEQFNWLSSGVNSADLYEHIVSEGKQFDYLVFAPYLFPTTFWGSMIYPEKSILLPCLHDEQYAYLEVFRSAFQQVKGLFFNAQPEMELAESLYQIPNLNSKSFVIGMGFEEPEVLPAKEVQESPFLLYTGRKETGKGLDLLIHAFSKYKENNPNSDVRLKIIGSGSIDFIDSLPEGIDDLGFVDEKTKLGLMRNALALCQPSVNESFSIVLMESWLQKTPVIVNKDCAVTSYHVLESQAGFTFDMNKGLGEPIESLLNSPELVLEMGVRGKEYVSTKYSWKAVQERLCDAFEVLGKAEDLARVEVGG